MGPDTISLGEETIGEHPEIELTAPLTEAERGEQSLFQDLLLRSLRKSFLGHRTVKRLV